MERMTQGKFRHLPVVERGRLAGLAPSGLRRIRLTHNSLGPIDLAGWSGIILGGGPYNVSDAPDSKSATQQRVESELLPLIGRVVDRDFPFLGCCYGVGTLGSVVGATVGRTYSEQVGAVTITLTPAGRADPLFVKALFKLEVPEIQQNLVEIRASAREVGSRTKIAVFSRDDSVDPVGACVGLKGSRVQAVVNELGGERIDIVPWSADPERFAKLALAPARVARVFSDPATKTIQAIVDEDQLSLAIGRNGQNVRLASELTEWKIELYSSREWTKNYKIKMALVKNPKVPAAIALKFLSTVRDSEMKDLAKDKLAREPIFLLAGTAYLLLVAFSENEPNPLVMLESQLRVLKSPPLPVLEEGQSTESCLRNVTGRLRENKGAGGNRAGSPQELPPGAPTDPCVPN